MEVLAEIALIYTSSESFNKQTTKTMEIIGKALSASRVYIFIDDEDGRTTNNKQ